jgi:hypothetical protein
MPVPIKYRETDEYTKENPSKRYTGLVLEFDDESKMTYVKVIQIGDRIRFNSFISGNLQIVVRKKKPNNKSGLVEGNLFDLDFDNKGSIYQYYVKPIGKWSMFTSTEELVGPMSLDKLKKDHFIYIHRGQLDNITEGENISFDVRDDNTIGGIKTGPGIVIGGKTRRRRRTKKASRKSRRNRKR